RAAARRVHTRLRVGRARRRCERRSLLVGHVRSPSVSPAPPPSSPELAIMRLVAKILGSIFLLILICIGTGFAISSSKIGRKYTLDTHVPPIPTDSASIEHGRHLARAIGKCTSCHGEDLAGKDFIDGGPLG